MDQKWYLGLIKAIVAQQQSSGFEYCRLQTWFKHKEETSWKKLESRANFSYQRNYCFELCTMPVADRSTKLWVVCARWGESTQALFLLCIQNIWLSLPVFVTCQLNYCKNMFYLRVPDLLKYMEQWCSCKHLYPKSPGAQPAPIPPCHSGKSFSALPLTPEEFSCHCNKKHVLAQHKRSFQLICGLF